MGLQSSTVELLERRLLALAGEAWSQSVSQSGCFVREFERKETTQWETETDGTRSSESQRSSRAASSLRPRLLFTLRHHLHP